MAKDYRGNDFLYDLMRDKLIMAYDNGYDNGYEDGSGGRNPGEFTNDDMDAEYQRGYKAGTHASAKGDSSYQQGLDDFREALLDRVYLRANFGCLDIEGIIREFKPEQIIHDFVEYRKTGWEGSRDA